MKSRVHPKYKTRYRVTNWREYESGLVQRGDVTVWLSSDALKAWKAKPTGRRGAQPKFSDLAIETALTMRLVFSLPLRQTEGFLGSLFKLMGVDLEAPDNTTLSRRSATLNVSLPQSRRTGPINLIIDSSGLAIAGEGEWAAVKHGGNGRRGWKKESGYHRQGRVENTFFRFKAVIGERLRARTIASQETEAAVACNVLNQMQALGWPKSEKLGS